MEVLRLTYYVILPFVTDVWIGNNCITIFNSKMHWDTVRDMTSEKLWEDLAREIVISKYARKNRKFLAFLSFSGKNECSQRLAIGGGGLALCDANYLQTWPATLDDLNLSFDSDSDVCKYVGYGATNYVFPRYFLFFFFLFF